MESGGETTRRGSRINKVGRQVEVVVNAGEFDPRGLRNSGVMRMVHVHLMCVDCLSLQGCLCISRHCRVLVECSSLQHSLAKGSSKHRSVDVVDSRGFQRH